MTKQEFMNKILEKVTKECIDFDGAIDGSDADYFLRYLKNIPLKMVEVQVTVDPEYLQYGVVNRWEKHPSCTEEIIDKIYTGTFDPYIEELEEYDEEEQKEVFIERSIVFDREQINFILIEKIDVGCIKEYKVIFYIPNGK